VPKFSFAISLFVKNEVTRPAVRPPNWMKA
jgi:hypothetical protein